jgi:isocitrate dehydrogenase (NAD+)
VELERKTIIVMEGDQTGQELLEESLRVLDPSVTGLNLEFKRYDLSLENRRATENNVVHEAAAATKETGFGLKAATVTPEAPDDVGSPNAILRRGIDGTVILRTGRRIPGVNPLPGIHAPISVVRMAVDDAYGAKEWREGEGMEEVAYRTEKISRKVCRGVAEFAFIQARRTRAEVFGGPKWTVSPVYEGMLKEEMDRAAEKNRDVRYNPQLIDATYALLLTVHGHGRGSARHGAKPLREGRREPDGDDPRGRGTPHLLPQRRGRPGLTCDLRGDLRVGTGGESDAGPRGTHPHP